VSDPSKLLHHQQNIVTFVDDTSFLLTSHPSQLDSLVQSTERLLNIWDILLRLTGGQLALDDKTKWCLSYYSPSNTNLVPHLSRDDPYRIFLHSDSTTKPLHRISPDQAERYLGVRIAISGQMETEYQYRLETAKHFSTNITQSSLNKHEVWISFRAIWIPKIMYCLPLTTFTCEDPFYCVPLHPSTYGNKSKISPSCCLWPKEIWRFGSPTLIH